MKQQKAGFVGVGNMGEPMARRLLAAGYEVVVYDVRPAIAAQWNSAHSHSVGSLAALAEECETVFLSLPTPDVVEAVALADAMTSATTLQRIVDLSTTGPEVSQRVASGLHAAGKHFVDAPVSGGIAGAVAGTLAVMVACDAGQFAATRPMLEQIGRIFHVGEQPGQGQMMKLMNNLLSAAALALSSEMAVLGTRAGLDPAIMMDVFNAGSGRNSATQDKFPRTILPRTFDYGFTNRLMTKDVLLCLDMAARNGIRLPIATSVGDTWQRTLEEIGPDEDFTSVVWLYERAAGVEVKPHDKAVRHAANRQD